MDSRSTSRTDALTIAIVGAGRLGNALTAVLRTTGYAVLGPFGRGYDGLEESPDVVLLCVPDRQIAVAASALVERDGMLVGHCSGATTLRALGAHESFSLHPLMTIPHEGAVFTGATAAVAGSTDRALAAARTLAAGLGMNPVDVSDDDRIAYHAAASIASNQLLAVLELADSMASTVGLEREQLGPIVRATVDNWLATGAATALTGPVVRGDEEVLSGHRAAVRERSHADLPLYDALLTATRRLATRGATNRSAAAEPPTDQVPTGSDPGSGDNDHSTHTDDTDSGHAGGYVSEGDA